MNCLYFPKFRVKLSPPYYSALVEYNGQIASKINKEATKKMKSVQVGYIFIFTFIWDSI